MTNEPKKDAPSVSIDLTPSPNDQVTPNAPQQVDSSELSATPLEERIAPRRVTVE